MYKFPRYICKVCGKNTASRKPQDGDGSIVFPRKHNGPDGKLCGGVFMDSDWVDHPAVFNKVKGTVKGYFKYTRKR
jgi:hypothetical protein